LILVALVAAACTLEQQEDLVQELRDSHSHGVNREVEAAIAATENAGVVANDLGDIKAGKTETGLVKLVEKAARASAESTPSGTDYDDWSSDAKVDRAMKLTRQVEAPHKHELEEANDETPEGKVEDAMRQTQEVAALGDKSTHKLGTDALVKKALSMTTSFAEDKQDVGDSAEEEATMVAHAISATEAASHIKEPTMPLKAQLKAAMKATANDVEVHDSMPKKVTTKDVRQATEEAVLPTMVAEAHSERQLGDVNDKGKTGSIDAAEAMAMAATEEAASPGH